MGFARDRHELEIRQAFDQCARHGRALTQVAQHVVRGQGFDGIIEVGHGVAYHVDLAQAMQNRPIGQLM